ncbi:MAG: DUF4160 domain-containing protein [Xanthobacteraceae bacterium]
MDADYPAISGFRFFFYSLEGSEPAHVHIEHGDSIAKFWLNPVSLAESRGFRSHELTRLRILVTVGGLECPFRPLSSMRPRLTPR